MLYDSRFDRHKHDHYATPAELLDGLVAGLVQLGLTVPSRVFDPCLGAGAIATGLHGYGTSVLGSDLYPTAYEASKGELYATLEPLDASRPRDLLKALRRAGPLYSQALITNPPFGQELGRKVDRELGHKIAATVSAFASLGVIDFAALLFKTEWAGAGERLPLFRDPAFIATILCHWRPAFFGKGGGKQSFAWYLWTAQGRSGSFPALLSISRAEAKAAAGKFAAIAL